MRHGHISGWACMEVQTLSSVIKLVLRCDDSFLHRERIPTCRNRSKGRFSDGVPESSSRRSAQRPIAAAASVNAASGALLCVRIMWDSSATTTLHCIAAMQCCGRKHVRVNAAEDVAGS